MWEVYLSGLTLDRARLNQSISRDLQILNFINDSKVKIRHQDIKTAVVSKTRHLNTQQTRLSKNT